MPSKEEVLKFVQDVLDKSRVEDYNLYVKFSSEGDCVAFRPNSLSAQQLLDEVKG